MSEQQNEMLGDLEAVPLDVSEMRLDLTKEEKLRTTALMLGIRYYTETIIKDASYLQLMMQREKEAKFSNDPSEQLLWHLKPASVNGVIRCAQEFEAFLLGLIPNVRLIMKHKDGSEEVIDPPTEERSGGPQDNLA